MYGTIFVITHTEKFLDVHSVNSSYLGWWETGFFSFFTEHVSYLSHDRMNQILFVKCKNCDLQDSSGLLAIGPCPYLEGQSPPPRMSTPRIQSHTRRNRPVMTGGVK